jgi:hypothetical protein
MIGLGSWLTAVSFVIVNTGAAAPVEWSSHFLLIAQSSRNRVEDRAVDGYQADDVQAARLMLYVLDAFYPIAESDFRSRRYRVLPDTSARDFERAAQTLASLAKPVKCRAQVDASALAIVCQSEPPPRTESERITQENHTKARTVFADRMIKNHAPVAATDVVYRLTDGRFSMAVTLSVLRQWRRDYIVDGHAMTLAHLDNSAVEPEPGFAGTIALRGDDELLDSLDLRVDAKQGGP